MTPGMHNEKISNHDFNLEILDKVGETIGEDDSGVKTLAVHLLAHRKVVEKFGRYPYRTDVLGRESTAQEKLWLQDYENLPGFAKSRTRKTRA